jgi:putative membrane protein
VWHEFLVFPVTKNIYMKRKFLSLAVLSGTLLFTACNNDESSSASTTDTSSTTNSTGSDNMNATTDTGSGNMNSTMSNAALSDMDRAFVMKAAMGGMMEVESSRIEQESGASQRVKDVATLIMRDHTNANTELKSLASAKGLVIPEDSLKTANKSHMDAMRKMKGAALDKHYLNMMMNDHNKDIAEFEKAATSLTDPDLKAWAAKTLPTLRMHKDSVQAANKSKM